MEPAQLCGVVEGVEGEELLVARLETAAVGARDLKCSSFIYIASRKKEEKSR
jgi:hypothetical protein